MHKSFQLIGGNNPMLTQRTLIISAAIALTAASASADAVVYVTIFNGQFGAPTPGLFGTVDANTGMFNQLGPALSDPLGGIVSRPGGALIGVSFSGNLDSINPTTGAVTVIGATGLGGLALDTAQLNGTVYETDLNQNLYTINTTTGLATLIGPTGIPPAPTDPADLFDEALFSANGALYATWDSFNATTLAFVDNPELYQINPITGVATEVGPTGRQIDAAIAIGGTNYAFTATNQVLSLNLSNGNTSFVTNYDAAAFFITGAASTPEPSSLTLLAMGITTIVVSQWRRRPTSGETGVVSQGSSRSAI
jgi:hypothetical protein